MDIIKKNLVSVISGVVAILAVTAMFWPINGMYANIEKSLAESEQIGQRVQSVINDIKSLKKPVADDNAAPEPLGTFPTEDVIKEGERVVALLEKQSKAVMDRARSNNTHKVICEGALPNMVGASIFQRLLEQDFQKREKFKKALNAASVMTNQSIVDEASKQFREKWLPNIGKVNDSYDPTELRKELERLQHHRAPHHQGSVDRPERHEDHVRVFRRTVVLPRRSSKHLPGPQGRADLVGSHHHVGPGRSCRRHRRHQ